MRYTYEIQRADWSVAHATASRLCRALAGGKRGFWLNVAAWALIGAGITAWAQPSRHSVNPETQLVGYVLLLLGAVAAIGVARYLGRRVGAALEAAVGPFPIATDVELEGEGLRFNSRLGNALVRWAAMQDVLVLPEHVAVVLRPYQVSVIPNRAFPDARERDEFVQILKRSIASADASLDAQA